MCTCVWNLFHGKTADWNGDQLPRPDYPSSPVLLWTPRTGTTPSTHSIIPKQAGWGQHHALAWGCCGRQLNSPTKNDERHSTTYSVIFFWWQHRWSSFLENLDLELGEVICDVLYWEGAGIPGGLLVKRRPLGARLALQGVHTTLN